MAVADITEYDRMPVDAQGAHIQTGVEPALVNQQVAIGAEAKSSAFDQGTQFVRVHVDAPCRILFGVNPTASATSMRMAANATEYFGVKKGTGMKISVISST